MSSYPPNPPRLLFLTFPNITELNQLTGIAAILTFPLDIEVVEAEEREAEQQSDKANIDTSGGNTFR